MASDKQLVTYGTTSKFRIRTNIVFMKPIRLYVPDNDESVPYAFAFGRHTISIAKGREHDLLSGYFSALCAVLPDLTNVAKKVLQDLGFRMEEIAVPSQADIRSIEISHESQDLKFEILMLAQMCYLPFANRFDGTPEAFWYTLAGSVGVNLSSYMTCSVKDMETMSSAMMTSGLKAELKSFIAPALHALASTSTPVGVVLSEAARLIPHHAKLFSF